MSVSELILTVYWCINKNSRSCSSGCFDLVVEAKEIAHIDVIGEKSMEPILLALSSNLADCAPKSDFALG